MEGNKVFHWDMLSSLERGAVCEERTQQKVGYRAGDMTGGLDLEEWKQGKALQLVHFFSGQSGLWVPREGLLEVETGTKQWVEARMFGWGYLCDQLEMGEREPSIGALLQIWR